MRQEEWEHAEITFGLIRPDLADRVIYVHSLTNRRVGMAPSSWDPIPVGHNWVPGEILSDIARWYNDIFDQWGHLLVARSYSQGIYGFTQPYPESG